mmetsp:Transcript_94415/g.224893  ORF Transcript_94415/g.224893 Transcript_94415/m.224893 type:complete len:240 (+) Transcript_94415:131-850(+)
MARLHQLLWAPQDVPRPLGAAVEVEEVPLLGVRGDLRAQGAVGGGGGPLHHRLSERRHGHAAVEQGREAPVSSAQARADDARVHRAPNDVGVDLLQVPRVQSVQRLGHRVLRELVVLLLGARNLRHVEIVTRGTSQRRQDHHPHLRRGRRLLELRHQQLGEQKVAQVVGGELELEVLLRRQPLGGRHDARVADEVVQRQLQGQEGLHEGLHGGEVRQLDLEDGRLARQLALLLLQLTQH